MFLQQNNTEQWIALSCTIYEYQALNNHIWHDGIYVDNDKMPNCSVVDSSVASSGWGVQGVYLQRE